MVFELDLDTGATGVDLEGTDFTALDRIPVLGLLTVVVVVVVEVDANLACSGWRRGTCFAAAAAAVIFKSLKNGSSNSLSPI